MAANANRQEATTTSAYERALIDAIVQDAETEYLTTFDIRPSDGIRGAVYTGIVTVITTRTNEELAKIGRPTNDADAESFRTRIISGVMAQPAIVDHHISYFGCTAETYRQITYRIVRDIANLPVDGTLSAKQVVMNLLRDSAFMRYWAYHEFATQTSMHGALNRMSQRAKTSPTARGMVDAWWMRSIAAVNY